ncbi:MAG: S1/P1 nuclease [Alistipes sp.]|nr:S1/P1 nuclease [Candidatus Alistipes equi]
MRIHYNTIWIRTTIAVIFTTFFFSSMAWNRVGHATIAKIAEDHLTEKAKKEISTFLDGSSIVRYASFADDYKGKVKVDIGFEPKQGKRVISYPHTFEADAKTFEAFRGINKEGMYVKNCVHFIEKYTEELKNRENLSKEEIALRIKLIVHFVGDMHCPEHIRYYPDDMTIGYYNVTIAGKEIRYHTLWDGEMLTNKHPWGFLEISYLIDTYTEDEIKKITQGTPYDWAKDSAQASWPIHSVKENDVLKKSFYQKWQNLTESQVCKAGYRLAKVLNDIFD